MTTFHKLFQNQQDGYTLTTCTFYSHCTLPNPCEAKTNVKIVISPLLKPTAA